MTRIRLTLLAGAVWFAACAWDRAPAPTPEHPCGLGKVCPTQHTCCGQEEICGGEPGAVGCPAGQCCFVGPEPFSSQPPRRQRPQ